LRRRVLFALELANILLQIIYRMFVNDIHVINCGSLRADLTWSYATQTTCQTKQKVRPESDKLCCLRDGLIQPPHALLQHRRPCGEGPGGIGSKCCQHLDTGRNSHLQSPEMSTECRNTKQLNSESRNHTLNFGKFR